MQVQNYNLDAPIPTSCVPWGSRNPTATEVRLRIDDLLGHIKDQAQHKKEKNMCYDTPKTAMCYNTPQTASIKSTGAIASIQVEPDRSDQAKRDHLLVRLRNAEYKKERDAADVFNLYAYNSPKNFRELIAAIKDGKFQIDEKIAKKMDARIADGEPTWCHSPFYGIIWDGPQKDIDGYQAFLTDMGTAYTKAKDEILVLPIEKGLEALRTFEALEVTPKA